MNKIHHHLVILIATLVIQCNLCNVSNVVATASEAEVTTGVTAKDTTDTTIEDEGEHVCQHDNDNNTCSATSTTTVTIAKAKNFEKKQQQQQEEKERNYKFPGCGLYLAPSTVKSENAGLGIFTTRPLKRGQPIAFPDIIIQVIDFHMKHESDSQNQRPLIGPLIDEYSWDATKFGGQLEAKRVASILPGLGSIANAQSTFSKANALPFRPDVDEANVPRTTKSGAGSFTHYHNLTFFATKSVQPGSEIFLHYDYKKDLWIQNRTIMDYDEDNNDDDSAKSHQGKTSSVMVPGRDVKWLTQNGICLDNIKPAQSKVKSSGRGAFATRFIPKGSIIAPVPLVVISNRDALKIPKRKLKKSKKKTSQQQQKQLLLNYCFGHRNSSVLFYPTSPIVNLINHAPTILPPQKVQHQEQQQKKKKKNYTANAKIQWSKSHFYPQGKTSENSAPTLSIEELKQLGATSLPSRGYLLMEFIATRDIEPKEEILFDYGITWTNAWKEHEASWEPVQDANAYSPSYVMEDVAGLLRNEKEQVDHPYPSNVQISCFYQYSVYHKKKNAGILASSSSSSSSEVTTVKWQMDRRTFEFENLRPCSVLEREKLPNGQWSYKMLIKNRYGLPKEEMIPKGEMHVVGSMPRGAIRFTDKIYSTDQHLPNAFRHEIGIPDEIFPREWMDLI